MKRRHFLASTATALATLPAFAKSNRSLSEAMVFRKGKHVLRTEIAIIGGGLGGCAAALAALEMGARVIMTEETDWIGGQLTSQGVPPDENRWIESHGCTRRYRSLRDGIREYYRRFFPLTASARASDQLNPGMGAVSRLCSEPRVGLAVLEAMLARYQASQQLQILLDHRPMSAEVEGDSVKSVRVRSLRSGNDIVIDASMFIDATELGELLPMAGVEHVMGAESRSEFGEPHAPERASRKNQQAFTVCFAIDHVEGEDHRIDPPASYGFWKNYVPKLRPAWPGRLLSFTYSHPITLEPRTLPFSPVQDDLGPNLNLWKYRRIASRTMFEPGTYPGDISLINWPQNDYWIGNLVGVSEAEAVRHVKGAKELSLSLLHWLQTEAPRPDGRQGWPGLRLRGDLMGTMDGMAKYPYIRESRRIKAVTTVTELDCGREARAKALGVKETEAKAAAYPDTVGIGHYNIDLHPTTTGDNYIDVPSLPFEIPLGALLPVRVRNLLPACKNLGVTHITNGCYRLHPVEWNIGEAAGALAAFALRKGLAPHAVREREAVLAEFQAMLTRSGVELRWKT